MASPGLAPARDRIRRGLTDPSAVTSTTSGPGDRVMLPPISAVAVPGSQAQETVEQTVERVDKCAIWQRQRQQCRARLSAHRRQIAQVHRQRPMADRVGRDESARSK